jgi:hypothetical protein
MESLDELSKASSGKPGFFKHVFNFDEESKAEMLNLVQYVVISLVPVIILNKLMQRYVPEADDEKGSLEITAEVLAQVLFMFFGILIIHRIVTYVPTYSEEKYPTWNVIGYVIPMLVILTSLQTKLGEKISILFDRVVELWEGPKDKKGKKGNGNVKVSQPISQNTIAMNQSLNSMGSTSISALPPAQTQQLPNYDQMYQQNSTPLVGAETPGMESFEPMAANAMSGGFGSAFGW